MKMIRTIIISATLVLAAAVGAITPMVQAHATSVDPGSQVKDGVTAAGTGNGKSLGENLKQITNLLLFVIGAIAVIVIIIGGMRYVLSGGDSNQITSAKNTILYAVVGLIVAILAFAIVNFVIAQFV